MFSAGPIALFRQCSLWSLYTLSCSLHAWTEECIPKLISGGTNVPCISPYMCQLFRSQESHQRFQSQDTHWFPRQGKFGPHHVHDITKVHVVMTRCMSLHPKQHQLNHCLILGYHLRAEGLAKFWKHCNKNKTNNNIGHLIYFFTLKTDVPTWHLDLIKLRNRD